jgi:hypothetical protein
MTAVNRLARLAEDFPGIPARVLLKAHLLFEGLRFNPTLQAAGAWALPSFKPYFTTREERRAGLPETVPIPYLMHLAGGELVRVKCDPESPYEAIAEDATTRLFLDGEPVEEIAFQARPRWYSGTTADGRPMAQVGLSQHGDMLVINAAPGCEFFVERDDAGHSLQCRFCSYGRPDRRTRELGQEMGQGPIRDDALQRVVEGVVTALPEVRHIYLVAGSLADNRAEGERYLQLTEALIAAGVRDVPITAGPSALCREDTQALKEAGATAVSYNLEVWGHELFAAICPGKERFIGYDAWLQRLAEASEVMGAGNVLTAMVAGIEVDHPAGYPSVDQALDAAEEGADWLLAHGVAPVYSLHWSTRHATYGHVSSPAFDYFLRLARRVHRLRRRQGLTTPGHIVCPRCAYMQLDPDFDGAA